MIAKHLPRARRASIALSAAVSAFALSALLCAAQAQTADISRTNWVPNNGVLADGESAVGDLWTFACPKGGAVTVRIDTSSDNSEEPGDADGANLSPQVTVYDGVGQVVAGTPSAFDCTYTPTCGVQCPQVALDCGSKGGIYSLVVQDKADNSNCVGGGGYVLTLDGADGKGAPLSQKSVKLGGGPVVKAPKGLTAFIFAGPAIDDGAIPTP